MIALLETIADWAYQELPPGIPREPPPLPGGVAAVFRWFFQVPQWIQIMGGLAGALLALFLAWFLWRRRIAIWRWLGGRPLAVQGGLALLVATVIFGFAAAGTVSWNYMQRDNDFCAACHVMDSAFQRFANSEHAELLCHDCHQQSIFASLRQLHLWVADRPEEIGEHAPVPTATCTECHQTGRDSTWQRVLATAGHRTHLDSDSSALADVMCVTCHGQEVHRFVPATQTCGQNGCHAEEDTRIVLGTMAEQTGFHCIACHEFTVPVPAAASRDSVLAEFTPTHSQCLSCHEMSDLLDPFDARSEPHGAVCGDCHNPHTQATPEAAIVSCAGGGCHEDAEALTPFHRGLGSAALEDCLSCHVAHTWSLEGSACLDCHADVLRRRPVAGLGTVPSGFGFSGVGSDLALDSGARRATPDRAWFALARHLPAQQSTPAAVQAAPFDHYTHAEVGCEACHSSERSHGEVIVRTEAQCARCHHESAKAGACQTCHTSSELTADPPRIGDFATVVASRPVRRSLDFRHADHARTSCEGCHRPADRSPERSGKADDSQGSFAPTPGCASCHDDHHAPEARCSACHTRPPAADAHVLAVHVDASCAGSGCHERGESRIRYAPAESQREACLSCHVDLVEHEPDGRCASCHMVQQIPLTDPSR